MLALIKFCHLLIAITLYGLCIASCYYSNMARKLPSETLYLYSLKQSLRLDYWLIYPAFLLTFIFGTGMVHLSGLSMQVAWVQNAYLFLGLNVILWLISTGIRANAFKTIKRFNHPRCHLVCQLLVTVIFLIIIHDAITQSTWITL